MVTGPGLGLVQPPTLADPGIELRAEAHPVPGCVCPEPGHFINGIDQGLVLGLGLDLGLAESQPASLADLAGVSGIDRCEIEFVIMRIVAMCKFSLSICLSIYLSRRFTVTCNVS